MASNHDNCAKEHHRRTFTFVIDERTEERRQNHSEYREPFEESCCLGIGDRKGLFEEVRCETLEGEDSGVVEHAKERYDPEHLRLEDLSEVGDVELILRIFLGSRFSDSHELVVKAYIHDGEHKEIEQTDHKEQRSEEQRSGYGVRAVDCKTLAEKRCKPHRSEDTETSNRHLQTHCERHLFAFEPLSKDLADGSTRHLASAAEDHKSEHRQFGATGHGRPPRVQPLHSVGFGPRDAPVFDSCSDNHEAGREQTGETDSHLIEDDTCEDEETEDVEQVLACCVSTEITAIPVEVLLQERSEGREDVHEHIGEEHHRSHQH